MMGKEQPSQTPESEADTTAYREPRESAGDELSLSKKAAQDDCKDSEDGSTHEAPDNANPGKEQGGNTSRTTTEEETYISGLRLLLVWLPLSLVAFLMLLDISIVATVNLLVESLLYGIAYGLTIQ